GFRAIRQVPNEVSEMCKARLCQRLVNGLNSSARLGLELEAVNVDLRARQQLEAHRSNQNVVGARPLAAVWSKRGRIVDDPCSVGRKIKSLSEWAFEIMAQRLH